MILLSRETRIDWPRIVANLQARGMSLGAIADEIGVAKSQVGYWGAAEATGEPAYWSGQALVAVWCRRTGLRWEDVPTRRIGPSVAQVLRSS